MMVTLIAMLPFIVALWGPIRWRVRADCFVIVWSVIDTARSSMADRWGMAFANVLMALLWAWCLDINLRTLRITTAKENVS